MMMTETVREESTMSVITQISLTDTETGGSEDLEDKSHHYLCIVLTLTPRTAPEQSAHLNW